MPRLRRRNLTGVVGPTTLSDVQRSVAKLHPINAFQRLRFGFELETQSFMTLTDNDVNTLSSQWRDVCRLDRKAWQKAKEEEMNRIKNSWESLCDSIKYHESRTFAIPHRIAATHNSWKSLRPTYFVLRSLADAKKALSEELTIRIDQADHVSSSLERDAKIAFIKFIADEKVTFADVINSIDASTPLGKQQIEHILMDIEHLANKAVRQEQYYEPDPAIKHHWPKHDFVSATYHEFLKKIAGNNWDSRLEYTHDGSVAGVEIRPKKPLSHQESIDSLSTLFRNKMEIDEKCSFHVHVSIAEDFDSTYNRDLQLFMIEYIITHLAEVPESCRNRWKDPYQTARYFAILPSDDKYCFVAFRGHLRTWEFRCFGNITNAADGQKCIELAGRAYMYALRRLLKEEKGNLINRPNERHFKILRETLFACLNDSSKLVKAKDTFKEEDKKEKQSRVGAFSKATIFQETSAFREERERRASLERRNRDRDPVARDFHSVANMIKRLNVALGKDKPEEAPKAEPVQETERPVGVTPVDVQSVTFNNTGSHHFTFVDEPYSPSLENIYSSVLAEDINTLSTQDLLHRLRETLQRPNARFQSSYDENGNVTITPILPNVD